MQALLSLISVFVTLEEKFVLGIVRLIFNFILENRRSRKFHKLTYEYREECCNVHGSSSIVLVLFYGS